ncbi:MAG: hypothetical protein JST89_04110 [Cyanobacteria bacterium SZAS-4]|nr:hypothetical protein [Cyanobacteria bacterium SZAS-4]
MYKKRPSTTLQQRASHTAQCLLTMSLIGFSCGSAEAQSLKADTPAPLKAGVNRGLVDALVGSHYWTFNALPGANKVHVTYAAMGVLGSVPRTSVTFTLSDPGNTWHTSKVLTSQGAPVDATFDADLKTPTKVIISVVPPSNALLRVGGNYEIEATGNISYGSASSTTAPIVGVYKQLSGYTKPLGDCKFTADGQVVTTSGATGNWKLFDEDTHIYVVNIDGEERHSLKFIPGRGLVDNDIIVYQQLR